jgi:hypothetical protein
MARGKSGKRRRSTGRPAASAADGAGHPVRRAALLILVAGVAVAIVLQTYRGGKTKLSMWGVGITIGGDQQQLTPAEQRERSREVEQQVEAKIQEASASRPGQQVTEEPTPPIDLRGSWTSTDGAVTWVVSFEQGYFVFREYRANMQPGVTAAAGYGIVDGRTWSVQFQDFAGNAASAMLALQDDQTLAGVVDAYGRRYQLELRRSAAP